MKINRLLQKKTIHFNNIISLETLNYLLRKPRNRPAGSDKLERGRRLEVTSWNAKPLPGKPGGTVGPIYPLWARRRPGRGRIRHVFPIY